jgi:AP-3 complex subunit delta-1
MYEAGIAISGLSCFINADLARDLANDIMSLVRNILFFFFYIKYNFYLIKMTSTKAYIRKRAVLLLYKVFLNNPDALKPAFPRLKEKLEDPDPGFLRKKTKIFYFNFSLFCSGVQAAAVNVICELARRNPKNYLALAPIFFRLMTSSTNNWVLIKIIKLV